MPNNTDFEPIRCFDGNAQPFQPFWNFVDTAEGVELELYGVISEYSWLGDEITPAKFKEDLYAFGKGNPVLLKLNSPGGDVIAASVINAILTDYPGDVTVRIDGMAASAAVHVAMAANTVQIMDSAYMMIHDPAVVVFLAMLDIETLGSLRDQLRTIKDGIVSTYASRTGLSETQLAAMMQRETWMSARDAVSYGFADSIIESGQKARGKAADVANHAAFVNCLQSYKNVPANLLQVENVVEQTAEVSNTFALSDKQKREAQELRERINQLLKEK